MEKTFYTNKSRNTRFLRKTNYLQMETINYYPPPVRSLIIDDEIDICNLLGNILDRRNIENEYANSLQDSRERLKDHNFDFIFLDNYLPDGKGVDFIPYLKRTFPNLKIILITALIEQATVDKMKQGGIDCYLPKPLHTDSINDAIDDLLSRRSPQVAGRN